MSGPALPKIEKRSGGKDLGTRGSKDSNDSKGTENQDCKSKTMTRSQSSKSRDVTDSREPDRVRSKDTSEDGKWHQKHCNNKQLVIATTIQQAYPFDPYAQKTVSKKEQHFGMTDRRRGFGEVTIPQACPRKLNCRACARLLVDVDDKDHREGPFYFCRKCHENGRKYHICTTCWQDLRLVAKEVCPFGILTGVASPQRSDRRCRSVRSATSIHSKRNSACSLSQPAIRAMESSEELEGPSPAAVSPGAWKGSITEGKYKRDAALNLTFTNQGDITGSSATSGEEVTVNGAWRRDGLKITVAWSEGHAWGKARVVGQFAVSEDTATIAAKLISSDGGKGALLLKRPM